MLNLIRNNEAHTLYSSNKYSARVSMSSLPITSLPCMLATNLTIGTSWPRSVPADEPSCKTQSCLPSIDWSLSLYR